MAKVKTFLQKWVINNIGYKILAVVLAFVFWLVITNTIDPVTTRTITGIPVEIQNEELVLDGSRVYTVLSGSTATVVASGNRSIVGNLTASDFQATADFSELSITNAVPIQIELVGEKARYSASINLSLKTNSMVINLEDMEQKSLNVEVEFTGNESQELIVADASTTPARVTLHAPKSVIHEADHVAAQVQYSEVTGDGTLTKELVLYNKNGDVIEQTKDVYLSQKTVAVNITTNRLKIVPIRIMPYGAPGNGYVLSGVDLSRDSVSVRGTEEVLNQINEIILPGELLNISGQTADVTVSVNIEDYLPAGVTLHNDSGAVTITASISRAEEETTTKREEQTEEKETETETTEG